MTTDLSTELVLWQDDDPTLQPFDLRGGAVAIGPEGYVYFSVGDHLKPTSAQSLTSNLGKVMRIRPDGTVPTDNPFYDGAGPNRDLIWARGFRNPFRMSTDPVTGAILEGDVGDVTWEEVNRVVKARELRVAPVRGPLHGRRHDLADLRLQPQRSRRLGDGRLRRPRHPVPAEYRGSYFYGDYAQNWIRRLTFAPDGTVALALGFEPPDGSLDGPYGSPVDLKEGTDGALYYADVGGLVQNDGTVRRISYTPSNQPPVASSSAAPTSGVAPLTVTLSSAGTSDPEGQPLTYAWDFGDGSTSTEADPVHTYARSGTYTVDLRVSDGVNTSLAPPLKVIAGGRPQPTISAPLEGATFRGGDVIAYGGDATDPEDGTLGAAAFSWTVLFHHDDPLHHFIGPVVGVRSGQFTIPVTGHDFRGFTRFEVILEVTDSDGTSSTTSVFIFPQKVVLTFDTSPAGLDLIIDGVTKSAPQTYDTLVNFRHTSRHPTSRPAASPTPSGPGRTAAPGPTRSPCPTSTGPTSRPSRRSRPPSAVRRRGSSSSTTSTGPPRSRLRRRGRRHRRLVDRRGAPPVHVVGSPGAGPPAPGRRQPRW